VAWVRAAHQRARGRSRRGRERLRLRRGEAGRLVVVVHPAVVGVNRGVVALLVSTPAARRRHPRQRLARHRRRRRPRRRGHDQGNRQHDAGSSTARQPRRSFWWGPGAPSRSHGGAPECHGPTCKASSSWKAVSSSVLGEASSPWSPAATHTRCRGRPQLLAAVTVFRSGSSIYGQRRGGTVGRLVADWPWPSN
jgi:hypothetical protein